MGRCRAGRAVTPSANITVGMDTQPGDGLGGAGVVVVVVGDRHFVAGFGAAPDRDPGIEKPAGAVVALRVDVGVDRQRAAAGTGRRISWRTSRSRSMAVLASRPRRMTVGRASAARSESGREMPHTASLS